MALERAGQTPTLLNDGALLPTGGITASRARSCSTPSRGGSRQRAAWQRHVLGTPQRCLKMVRRSWRAERPVPRSRRPRSIS